MMTDHMKYVVEEIIRVFALNPLMALKVLLSTKANLKTKQNKNKPQTKNPTTFSDSN